MVISGGAPSPSFLGGDPDAFLLDTRIQAALARGRAGDSQESMRRLRALFAAHPTEEEAALAVLEAYDRPGQAAEAEKLLLAAVDAHPGSPRPLLPLAHA